VIVLGFDPLTLSQVATTEFVFEKGSGLAEQSILVKARGKMAGESPG